MPVTTILHVVFDHHLRHCVSLPLCWPTSSSSCLTTISRDFWVLLDRRRDTLDGNLQVPGVARDGGDFGGEGAGPHTPTFRPPSLYSTPTLPRTQTRIGLIDPQRRSPDTDPEPRAPLDGAQGLPSAQGYHPGAGGGGLSPADTWYYLLSILGVIIISPELMSDQFGIEGFV